MAAGKGRAHFPDSPPGGTPFSELWSRAHRTARWITDSLPGVGTVAGVLSSSEACLSVLLGTWLAGLRFASLPEPARAMPSGEYARQIAAILELAETDVLCAREFPPGVAIGGARCITYDEVATAVPSAVPGGGSQATGGSYAPTGGSYAPTGGSYAPTSAASVSGSDTSRLIQFTSGSTGTPKGVVLTMEAIAANVTAMAAAYEFGPSDVSVSWLPLSHDMGLIGTCLLPFIAMSADRGGARAAWFLTPEGFLRDPLAWLRVVSEVGGSFTMVPNFSLDIMARKLPGATGLDLRAFRNMTVSAETVRGDSLRQFAEAAGRFGFDGRALSPAYGMAEITLGATTVRPAVHWSSITVERETFADGTVVVQGEGWGAGRAPERGEEVVGLGPAFPGMEVRIATEGRDRVGPVQIAGVSLAERLIGAVPYEKEGEWFTTNDLGFMVAGELYFAGRYDDWIVVAGRNLDARDLEQRAGAHAAVRPGNCVVVEDDRGTYAVVAEPSDEVIAREEVPAIGEEVRAALLAACGVAPSRVVFVERGSLPKTPSGKLQRRRVSLALHGDGLSVVAEATTGFVRD